MSKGVTHQCITGLSTLFSVSTPDDDWYNVILSVIAYFFVTFSSTYVWQYLGEAGLTIFKLPWQQIRVHLCKHVVWLVWGRRYLQVLESQVGSSLNCCLNNRLLRFKYSRYPSVKCQGKCGMPWSHFEDCFAQKISRWKNLRSFLTKWLESAADQKEIFKFTTRKGNFEIYSQKNLRQTYDIRI